MTEPTQHPDHTTATKTREGAHPAKDGERITSRSADPGQSSYGGFTNEDTRRQAQQLDQDDKARSDK